jgi:hypothetical protein
LLIKFRDPPSCADCLWVESCEAFEYALGAPIPCDDFTPTDYDAFDDENYLTETREAWRAAYSEYIADYSDDSGAYADLILEDL